MTDNKQHDCKIIDSRNDMYYIHITTSKADFRFLYLVIDDVVLFLSKKANVDKTDHVDGELSKIGIQLARESGKY